MSAGNELRIYDESSCLCYNKNGDGQSVSFYSLLNTLDEVFEKNLIKSPQSPTVINYVLFWVDGNIMHSTPDLAYYLQIDERAKYGCTKISIYGVDEVKVMELSKGEGKTPWYLDLLRAVTGEIISIIHALWKGGMIIIPGNCKYLQSLMDEYDATVQRWLKAKMTQRARESQLPSLA